MKSNCCTLTFHRNIVPCPQQNFPNLVCKLSFVIIYLIGYTLLSFIMIDRVAFELQNKICVAAKMWIFCWENCCLLFSRQSSRGEREPLKLDSVAGRDFISIAIFNQWRIFFIGWEKFTSNWAVLFQWRFFNLWPLARNEKYKLRNYMKIHYQVKIQRQPKDWKVNCCFLYFWGDDM